MDNLNNKSPLRYPGGKTRACKLLDSVLSQHFDMNNYKLILSPFFGGGSFEFYLQNKYKLPILANDKFIPLYNFWNQVKLNKEKIISDLNGQLGVSKEKFIEYRNDILTLDNHLKQAVYYFIINRCSFSGSTMSGGFSLEASKKRFTSSSISRINNLNLDYIHFHNKDFSEFIKKEHNTGTIMFLDPPYYLEKKSKLYGNNGDLHENFDHNLLFNIIKNQENWLLTYNNCDYIRNLYSDFTVIDADWKYGMNKNKNSSEIIILSK
tara:strand:+ start:176 stop:970 length:795 start_codon:yes stop_codon:yes gene_type:complete